MKNEIHQESGFLFAYIVIICLHDKMVVPREDYYPGICLQSLSPVQHRLTGIR